MTVFYNADSRDKFHATLNSAAIDHDSSARFCGRSNYPVYAGGGGMISLSSLLLELT